jgi:hypothetical protein
MARSGYTDPSTVVLATFAFPVLAGWLVATFFSE